MPLWESRLIILFALVLLPLVVASSVTALTFGGVLWLGYHERHPEMLVIFAAAFLTVGMTLPLLG
jgi:hypothetical protein